MDERDTLRRSHTEFVSERALLIGSTAKHICALVDPVPDSTLSHALPIVTAVRRAPPPPPSSVFHSSTQVPDPNSFTAVSWPPLIDLKRLLTHLRHCSPSYSTQYTDPDLPRDVATPIPLVATDILNRLPPATPLSLTSLIAEVNIEVCNPPHHEASRIVNHLRSAYPTGAPAYRLPRVYTLLLWRIADVTRPLPVILSVAVARI